MSTPSITNFKSVAVVNSPFGPVNISSSSSNLDATVNTPFGPFSTNSVKAPSNGTTTDVTALAKAGQGFEGPDPEPATAKTMARFTGKLTKVHLYSYDFPGGAKRKFEFQYNPETIEFGYPNGFGEYNGVLRVPTLYYSGNKVDRISVRFIVVDRMNGVEKWLNQLQVFAAPNGTAQIGTATKVQFSAPPLTYMSFGKIGIFKGYVENPRCEVTMMDKDLKPLIGYLSFTFLSLKRKTVSSVIGSV
jgi:hypothetical protein